MRQNQVGSCLCDILDQSKVMEVSESCLLVNELFTTPSTKMDYHIPSNLRFSSYGHALPEISEY